MKRFKPESRDLEPPATPSLCLEDDGKWGIDGVLSEQNGVQYNSFLMQMLAPIMSSRPSSFKGV